MKIENGKLRLNREISKLDQMVLDFTDRLEEMDLNYVIVSGYVAILTGRSRGTEDIDIILEEVSSEDIENLGNRLEEEGYWCINSEIEGIYEMLEGDYAVRFAEEGRAIPNFEVRFPSSEFERIALRKSLRAQLGPSEIPISPMELQIAYKIYLGTEKDLEDALHLYKLFEDSINLERLRDYAKRLDVGDRLDELEET